ncbi:endonuclease/exonuclease/phosphatase family protein [Planctomycetota bacterium]|nr:endonuclease/exonuclease/phosphatase family protein [Planctomycetota bacterium]
MSSSQPNQPDPPNDPPPGSNEPQASHLTTPPSSRPPSAIRKLIATLTGIILFFALIVMLLTILSLAGAHYWLFDVFANFRFIFAEYLLFALIIGAIRQKWFWSTLILVCLMINLAYIAPLYLPPPSPIPPPPEAPIDDEMPEPTPAEQISNNATVPTPLKLLHLNVNNQNPNIAAVADYILSSGADLVFLQEVNYRWIEGLNNTMEPYELHTPRPRPDPFGVALFINKNPENPFILENATIIDLANLNIPAIEAHVSVGEQAYAILSVHAHPPLIPTAPSTYTGWMSDIRDKQLRAAYYWASQQSNPPIIIGDLNATPFSYTMREIMNPVETEPVLVYSQQGYGYAPTWPAQLPYFLRLPIDHCLISPKLQATTRTLGPNVGSDHLPLYVEIIPLPDLEQ